MSRAGNGHVTPPAIDLNFQLHGPMIIVGYISHRPAIYSSHFHTIFNRFIIANTIFKKNN